MSGSKMTMIPVGGLANRMRTVASAIALMNKTLVGGVKIAWFRDWALNAPFGALFEPIDLPQVSLIEGNLWNGLLYDRPRRRNLWIPKVFQSFYYDYTLYENQVRECFDWNEELVGTVNASKKSYIAAFYQLCGYDNNLLRTLFRPVPEVLAEVNRRKARFSSYTIGVHIRRGDNIVAMRRSPLELFVEAIDKELALHSDLHVYLATDSEEVKQQLYARYGERISTASSAADRGSIAGIRDGMADMYTLACTNKIYGSSGSSFSELASQLGDVPLVLCKRD